MEDDLSLGRTVILGSQIRTATLKLTVGRLYAYNGPAMGPAIGLLLACYWPAIGLLLAGYWPCICFILTVCRPHIGHILALYGPYLDRN